VGTASLTVASRASSLCLFRRLVKLVDTMAWPHTSQSTSEVVAWENGHWSPNDLWPLPLNEIENLNAQSPTDLSRVNPERPRLSIDLPNGTRSACGMATPVDLGCKAHVDIKKNPSVQASRGIVVRRFLLHLLASRNSSTRSAAKKNAGKVPGIVARRRGQFPLTRLPRSIGFDIGIRWAEV
jgi:hypothetical protein